MTRILTASDRALLVEAADLDEAMRLHLAWRAAAISGVVELVPGARTVLVRFDPAQISAAALADALSAPMTDAAQAQPAQHQRIPVQYDGEDLVEVASLLSVSAEEIIARHQAAEWRVAFSGFAPGFGYLVCSDPLFDVPRRSSPRTRVPAGAVALAGEFTGVYPRESPGGWQLIGRTDAVMWDVDRDPPALLAPGTVVRFEQTVREFIESTPRSDQPEPDQPELDRPETSNRLFVEVVQPSLQLLVQDRGRSGHAALGVSSSGAADRIALRDANRAVGNRGDAAALESLGGGAVLRWHSAGVVAVTGGIGDLVIADAAGVERAAAHGAPFAVADGDELFIGPLQSGLRAMIAVRGGVDTVPALDSRSTDTLAGLGPAPLRAGDRLALGDPAQTPDAVAPDPLSRDLPVPGDVVDLDITLGPRDDWFTAAAIDTLTAQEWEVTPRSDRIGIRLHGQTPLERTRPDELPSEGAVTGAIQVPADGQPVLFLPDHPLTGGYPVIAAVADRSLDLAAQLPPGVRVRFRLS